MRTERVCVACGALTPLQAARKEGQRWGVADAEGRRDTRRDARERGEGDGRLARICWHIYTFMD